ncbi:MAG: hypothetical protein QOF46_3141, partial [Paraburkholderia sp.]|nr:hypothetical protein [Paraburkholderia sp.]
MRESAPGKRRQRCKIGLQRAA